MRPLIVFLLGTAFLSIDAGIASADLRKLDARTRFVYEQLQSGLPAQSLRDRGFAVPSEGTMEVFVRGDAGRAALEAAGARVRSALPGICTADLPLSAVEPVSDLPEVTAIGRWGGGPAPAGLYFAKLQAPGSVLSRRFVVAH